MKTAVIISTYNAPQALRLCLFGFLAQQDATFQILIADDGSDDRTREVLANREFDPLRDRNRMQHIWHADDGFRLSAIRNRAIAASEAEYLIFIDGDCIPRNDYVASYQRRARRNYFMAGGRLDIPAAVHADFDQDLVTSNQVFDPLFLLKKDSALRKLRSRLSRQPITIALLNLIAWRYCVFAGSNAAAWRSDLYRVNGFDESFPGYGSEDRDIGIRLRNAGVKSRYLKFAFCQLHLSHPRTYFDASIHAKNRAVFRQRRWDGTTAVTSGLNNYPLSKKAC